MNDSFVYIHDIRSIEHFKKYTISNFKKTEVLLTFTKCVYDKKCEEALFWISELICSGLYLDIWNCIIQCMSHYIQHGNPKLPIYIMNRFQHFREIISPAYTENEILARNNPQIRILFTEITHILCNSQTKHTIMPIKIKDEQLNLMDVSYLLKATNTSFVTNAFIKGDPTEIYIPLNEFAFHISNESKSERDAMFWFEWVLAYETKCKKKKYKLQGEKRDFVKDLSSTTQKDIIWIIWEFILHYSKTKSKLHERIIFALFEIFQIRYTNSMKRKRKVIVYHAITILCEHIDITIPILKNTSPTLQTTRINNYIYKEIKKHEVLSKDNYLFHELTMQHDSTKENTLKKIDLMNTIK